MCIVIDAINFITVIIIINVVIGVIISDGNSHDGGNGFIEN
jgi:hypothetical protein